MINASNSLGILVVSFDAIFLALSAVALGIRIWSRGLQGRPLSLNDYLALVAWVSSSTPEQMEKAYHS